VALTAKQWKDAALRRVGAALAGGPPPDGFTAQLTEAFGAVVDDLWDMNADRPNVRLRQLYTVLDLLEENRGQLARKADAWLGGRGGIRLQLSQRVRSLERLYADVAKRIEREEKSLRASGNGPVTVGRLLPPRCPGDVVTTTTEDAGGARVVTGRVSRAAVDPANPALGGWPSGWDGCEPGGLP
jgi:hypothetical protein